ncbi:MAG TPA: hypothetical protein DCX53_14520, partial [Anaerolineae bacterium]|nr:hypothetical protein [Anaerolineae bacterium]
MYLKYTHILIGVTLLFALATPSSGQTAPAEDNHSTFVTTSLTPPSISIGESSIVAVNVNNLPPGGFASAEFTCTYDPAMMEISAITPTDLFGVDPVTVVNGPQNGSLIFAVAGSVGNRAVSDGTVFTFSAKGLQIGQSIINCQVRASTGNLALVTIPSTPSSIDVTDNTPVPTLGTLAGQIISGKQVTVTLTDHHGSVAGSVVANTDGIFSLPLLPGTYNVVASAPGYLRAQGTVSITNGNTTTIQTIKLPAGDIDGNDVIDHFDALTIGINYNGAQPAVADLTSDGIINVLELEILSPNYRMIGPLAISVGSSPLVTQTSLPTIPTQTSVPVSATETPVAATATVAPLPTATTLPSGASSQLWHPPGAHDGLNAHEHGDKPPAWANDFSVANFGHPVVYGGDERSSDTENVHKHQAFKGVTYRVNGGSSCPVDVYFRYHAASNPMDRAFAFHSYELYMRDCQGGTSFRQGVYWVGYPEFRSQRMSRFNEQPGTILPDGSTAPGRDQFIIGAPDNRDWFGLNGILQTRCEQWYAFAGSHGGEFSITICGATTRFSYDEHLTNFHDMGTWDLTGSTGLGRRFEISLYGPNSPVPTNQPAGWFCAKKAPIEDKVEGPTHRPQWTLLANGINSPTDCPAGYLPQFTA